MGFPPVPQQPGGVPPTGPPAGPPPGPSGPYLPPPGGGGPGDSWFRRNRNWFLPALAVLVVLIVVAGFLVLSEDEANADEIFLEPVDFGGDDPFTEPVTVDGASALGEAVGELRDDDLVEGSVNGSEPGLYGGTLNQSVCDREQLVDFLGDNADKARAFADVLDIEVEDIPEYIASLTPVVLRGDTRVTNHGFRDGRATPFQAILEAGTAVLVDFQGIPRVKCYCGNPLLEPEEVSSPSYTGDRWDDFDPDDIQVTFVDIDIDIFVLTDVINGGTFIRPKGTDGDDDEPEDGDDEPPTTTTPPATTSPPDTTSPPPETTAPLGTGDVQVTLTWGGGVDLDLHVIDPSGTEINYSSPSSPSGGTLDTDAQSGCTSCVENIFWPTGGAPPGEYQVFVVNFSGSPSSSYTLDIRVGGEVIDSSSGTVGDGSPESETISFTVS